MENRIEKRRFRAALARFMVPSGTGRCRMERSLLWSAFAMGWVGWLCSALARGPRAMRPPGASAVPRAIVATAAALPVLVFLITLPSRPPFAAGQGLGRGFLLGRLCALLG